VGHEQAREPEAEAAARLGCVGAVPEAAVEERTGEAVAEHGGRGEPHHELRVLAGRSGPPVLPRQGLAALVHEIGEGAEQRRPAAAPRRVFAGEGAPGEEPRLPRFAEALEHAFEQLEHRGLTRRRAQPGQQLGLEARHHVLGEGSHQPLAAAEVMQDRRMGDAEVPGEILEPDGLGAAFAQALLRGLEDRALGLLGAPAGTGH
jgi:hypothetical protein